MKAELWAKGAEDRWGVGKTGARREHEAPARSEQGKACKSLPSPSPGSAATHNRRTNPPTTLQWLRAKT